MPRARLTEAEREARRKARARFSFSNAAYEHYDPRQEGLGARSDWEAAAEALASGRSVFKGADRRRSNPDLDLLGLTEMPSDIGGLKAGFRRAAMRTHPDHGGNAAEFRAVYAAYERLVRFF